MVNVVIHYFDLLLPFFDIASSLHQRCDDEGFASLMHRSSKHSTVFDEIMHSLG